MSTIFAALFAQDTIVPGTPNTITGAFILAFMSLVGVIVWLMRHVFLTTIPGIHADAKSEREATQKRDDDHQKETAAQREKTERVIEKLCDTFTKANDAERRSCDERYANLHASVAALTASVTQIPITMAAAVNEHTTKAMADYRHQTADMLQQAVLGRDLYLEKKKREALEETERVKSQEQQRRGVSA